MIKKIVITLMPLIVIALGFTSCQSDFLDAKPNSSIVNPTTLDELQGLLDNTEIMNKATPALPLLASDDYAFADYESWQGAYTATERNSYIWAKDIYAGETDIRDWSYPYKAIFICNNVLEGLDKIKQTADNTERWNNLRGRALFVRAFNYYDLVCTFSLPYDAETAVADLGVPLKLKAGIDEIKPRASVQQTYDQIIADLGKAVGLLPRELSVSFRNRPSKVAAYALAGRIYLSMRKYEKAEAYADSTLALYSKLIDYNTVDIQATIPFSINNDETLFSSSTIDSYFITSTRAYNTMVTVNPDLIKLFHQGDLRLSVFFTPNDAGGVSMKNQYMGDSGLPFTGLATDEIYLIKAECLARRNEIAASMEILNRLLVKRFKPAFYMPVSSVSSNEALQKILEERRKELVWRTLRWDDLRRLNKEGADIKLMRYLNGQEYTLAPNDPRYVFPIPDQEIALSGIEPNNR